MTETSTRIREFKMPDVGEGLTEAEILKWYVRPGDTVTDGQVVCEVETAKAAVELPIPYDGAVHELLFDEGTTVDVGTVIITVDTDPSAGPPAGGGAPAGEVEPPSYYAEAASAGSAEAEPAEPAEPQEGGKRQPVLVGYGVSASSTKRRPRKQSAQPAGAGGEAAQTAVQSDLNGHPGSAGAAPAPDTALAGTAPGGAAPGGAVDAGGRPLAKPPVRKLAKDLGIDLATVTPTGADGVITRGDVHKAAAAPAPAAPVAEPQAAPQPQPAAAPSAETAARETRIPVKGVRKATAAAMVSSAFTAPHVTEFVTVDVTRTMRLVQELKQDPDMSGLRVNPLLLVAKAFLVAIRRNPEVNASWDEENQEIVRKDYVNLGIAAATPRGLIVPNIKDAGARTLPELAAALGELVGTAREGKTTPAEMQGGTVTITNVGVFGVDTGTPILNPGESAILAFGQVREQPWVHKGKVKPRHVTTLALSFDHRLVDGALGSKVLADVAAVLERPKRLMTWT
ncbi:2-oxo acid dehydrogenase subunit E2 [Streptomyces armeniacus]|uniref:Dihydrolipoamide acetyltransferase component of pyruvate dehydrogenase complex n=1 Tax=Streptomyces armeniacus TaxID=83291 RepID=A0A345XZG9_9ACTN|nr:dihydrolipoamide acetyltransferase family protein [Streptomyces armeniacus]AXK37035.1 2-oxo acid dehydrogenase subunit E2 [Streptomyces armeniacus]